LALFSKILNLRLTFGLVIALPQVKCW
jgi:hypothetical protein